MKYTIEDLRGKYVEVGSTESVVFLDACNKVGAVHASERTLTNKFVELLSFDTGGLILYGFNSEMKAEKTSTPFTIKDNEWSIYTNTLPLCELTDEQAGQLFNAWRKGVTLQIFFDNDGTWDDYNGALCRCDVFRVKQKSEREQFVDAMMAGCSFDNSHAKTVRSVVEQIYDSVKFKLVKDGE